jgi:hypothetical protein
MSTHFNAPRRIGSFYSAPVDKEQWKLESRKVNNIGLALLQYHNLGIAQGLGHDLPRAVNLLSQYGIDARGMMLFPAPGSKNIKVFALLGFLFACAACWVLTWKISDGTQPMESTLLITWILLWAWRSKERVHVRVSGFWDRLSRPNFYSDMDEMLQRQLEVLKAKLR